MAVSSLVLARLRDDAPALRGIPSLDDGAAETTHARWDPSSPSCSYMADRQGVIRVVEMGAMQSTRVQAAFRLEHAAEGPEDKVRAVGRAFSCLEAIPLRAGALLASQAGSSNVLFLRLAPYASSPEPVFRFGSHAAPVASLAVSRNGALAACGSEAGALRVWRTFDGALASEHPLAHRGGTTAVGFAGVGTVVSGGRDGRLAVWDLARGQLVAIQWLALGPCTVTAVAGWAPHGVPASPEAWRLSELSRWEAPETHRCLVAAGSDSGEVHVAAMEAGEDAKLVHAGTFVVAEGAAVSFASFDRTGARLVCGGPGLGSRRDVRGSAMVVRTAPGSAPVAAGCLRVGGFLVGLEAAAAHEGARDEVVMVASLRDGPMLRSLPDIEGSTFHAEVSTLNAPVQACLDPSHPAHEDLHGARIWADVSDELCAMGLPPLPERTAGHPTGRVTVLGAAEQQPGANEASVEPDDTSEARAEGAPEPRRGVRVPAPVARTPGTASPGRGGLASGPGESARDASPTPHAPPRSPATDTAGPSVHRDVIVMPDRPQQAGPVPARRSPKAVGAHGAADQLGAKTLRFAAGAVAEVDGAAGAAPEGDAWAGRTRPSRQTLQSRVRGVDEARVQAAVARAHAGQLAAASPLGRPTVVSTVGLHARLAAAAAAEFDPSLYLDGPPQLGALARQAAAQEVTTFPLPVARPARGAGDTDAATLRRAAPVAESDGDGGAGGAPPASAKDAGGAAPRGDVAMYRDLPRITDEGAPVEVAKGRARRDEALARLRRQRNGAAAARGGERVDVNPWNGAPVGSEPGAPAGPDPALYRELAPVDDGASPEAALKADKEVDPVWAFLAEALRPIYGVEPPVLPTGPGASTLPPGIAGAWNPPILPGAAAPRTLPLGGDAPSKRAAEGELPPSRKLWLPTEDEVASFGSEDIWRAIDGATQLLGTLGVSVGFRRVATV